MTWLQSSADSTSAVSRWTTSRHWDRCPLSHWPARRRHPMPGCRRRTSSTGSATAGRRCRRLSTASRPGRWPASCRDCRYRHRQGSAGHRTRARWAAMRSETSFSTSSPGRHRTAPEPLSAELKCSSPRHGRATIGLGLRTFPGKSLSRKDVSRNSAVTKMSRRRRHDRPVRRRQNGQNATTSATSRATSTTAASVHRR